MRFFKQASGILTIASATACGTLPEFAKPPNESQSEQIDFLYQDTEAVMPIAEALWQQASPPFDAQGDPIDDPEIFLDDLHGVLADFHYYKEHGQIYVFNPEDAKAVDFFRAENEPSGYFVDRRREENLYMNDYILLNENLSWWSMDIIMHETAHRTDDHDDPAYYDYMKEIDWYVNFDRSHGKWLAASGDWAELQGDFFTLVQESLEPLRWARYFSRNYREAEGNTQALVLEWDEVSESILNMNGKEYDFELWQAEAVDGLWRVHPDMDGFLDEFGITKRYFETAFANEEVYRYMREEIQKEHERCRDLYLEARAELEGERRSELGRWR